MEVINEQTIAKFVSDAFGMKVRSVALLSAKVESSSLWKIKADEGVFVLKGSLWYGGFVKNPVAALECVYEVAARLAKLAVPLQTARRALSGGFVSVFNGLPTVLLEYKEGLSFDGSEAHFAGAGAALAGFHKTGMELLKKDSGLSEKIHAKVPVEKPYEKSRELYLHGGFREKLLTPHECANRETCDAVHAAIPLLDKTIAFIDKSFARAGKLSEGILHNDFSWANGLYNPDGSFVSFLDVDQLGIGPFILDIGNTLASFATEFLKKGTQKELEHLVNSFLLAYLRVFLLPAREYMLVLAATQRWDVMRVLRTMRRHHFENNRLPDLVPKVSKRFLPRIAAAPEWFKFLE